MKTLVIYDNDGQIFKQITGEYIKPNGLQHIEIDVPEGKWVVSVDVPTRIPIFEDIPKSETEILKEQLESQNQAIVELTLLLMGGM